MSWCAPTPTNGASTTPWSRRRYSVNVPLPTGVSPNVVQIFLNHPGFDPAHPDPYYNSGYPVISVNMDVWPGKTTYADTPIVPIRPNTGEP